MIPPFPYARLMDAPIQTNVILGVSTFTPYNPTTGFDVQSHLEASPKLAEIFNYNQIKGTNDLSLIFANWDSALSTIIVGYAYLFLPNSLFGAINYQWRSQVNFGRIEVLEPNTNEVIDFAISNTHTVFGVEGRFLYAKGVYRDGSYTPIFYADYKFATLQNLL